MMASRDERVAPFSFSVIQNTVTRHSHTHRRANLLRLAIIAAFHCRVLPIYGRLRVNARRHAEKGYGSAIWGTYKQWAEAGAQVRKSEKSAYIVFYKEFTVASEDGDSDDTDTRLFAHATPVFAAEQVEGWTAPIIDTPATIITPIEQAEAFVAATHAPVTPGLLSPSYRQHSTSPARGLHRLADQFAGRGLLFDPAA
jgi:hypothetical protein